MANFSSLLDSDDEKAVKEILSQAMDQTVLEQVAAINCSGFTDSDLPTHLETRFRKLKSLPASRSTGPIVSARKTNSSSSFNFRVPSDKTSETLFGTESNNSVEAKDQSDSTSGDENVRFSPSGESPVGKKNKKKSSESRLPSGILVSPSKFVAFSTKSPVLSPSEQKSDGKLGLESKSRSRLFSSPSDSSIGSLSPPRKSGCFWCSPKKDSKKKSKEKVVAGLGLERGKNEEEFMSDLNIFSTKEQRKILKKALKEEEKISREAEKIVKWAKQASERMNVSGLEDDLTDNESIKSI